MAMRLRLTLKTFDRLARAGAHTAPGDFDKSYLGIRFVIGAIGLALPIALVLVDAFFLDARIDVRDSMSAYYHSPARDLFVGGLAAIGVVLISYLWWRWDTWDFWLSVAAGLSVLGVAAFPTGRSGVETSATSCQQPQAPGTPPCAPLQALWGEHIVERLHFAAAALVVASFAALCLVFALRDFGYGVAAHRIAGNDPTRLGVPNIWREVRRRGGLRGHLPRIPRTILYTLCFAGVVLGAVWALWGPEWPAQRVYIGEFISFSFFGFAWMVASWDLLRRIRWVHRVEERLTGRAGGR
jgi:hypothetical protein